MEKVKVGDVYWDCAYHPVLCTESVPVKRHMRTVDYDIAGTSLYDGSRPRSCSVKHCGVIVLDHAQLRWLILNRDAFLTAEKCWRTGDRQAYAQILKELDDYLWGERFEDMLDKDFYTWHKLHNKFWWKSALKSILRRR